jgi:hypothetical protein
MNSAGIDAIAHLTVNATIDPNGIRRSVTITSWRGSLLQLPEWPDGFGKKYPQSHFSEDGGFSSDIWDTAFFAPLRRRYCNTG